MSFERIIGAAIRDAGIADAAFDAAIKKAGFKSRWDWFLREDHPELLDAYNGKVAADKRMHEELSNARRDAPIEETK